MATREQIRESKKGIHLISFQPGEARRRCTVQRVRGGFVWVLVKGRGLPVRLNGTSSVILLEGGYRP